MLWKITTAIEKKEDVIGVFKIKNEFILYTIDIVIIILQRYGIRRTAHNWISSYLQERKEDIKDAKSAIQNVICEVPQGSVLGPFLFILYIKNICRLSENHFICG